MHMTGAWFLLIFAALATAAMLLLLHVTRLGELVHTDIPDRPRRRLFLASVSFFVNVPRGPAAGSPLSLITFAPFGWRSWGPGTFTILSGESSSCSWSATRGLLRSAPAQPRRRSLSGDCSPSFMEWVPRSPSTNSPSGSISRMFIGRRKDVRASMPSSSLALRWPPERGERPSSMLSGKKIKHYAANSFSCATPDWYQSSLLSGRPLRPRSACLAMFETRRYRLCERPLRILPYTAARCDM